MRLATLFFTLLFITSAAFGADYLVCPTPGGQTFPHLAQSGDEACKSRTDNGGVGGIYCSTYGCGMCDPSPLPVGGRFKGYGSSDILSCSWECIENYYKSGSTCTACNTDYFTDGPGKESSTDCKKTCPNKAGVSNGTWAPDASEVSQGANCTYTDPTKLNCNAGSFKNTTTNTCIACPYGTYSTGNATQCTICGVGQTTSNTGSTSAGACTGCANPDGIITGWATRTWDNNTVSPATACTVASCKSGYKVDGTKCTGYTYRVKFNVGFGATAQADYTECQYGTVCKWTNTTTKTNSVFQGWASVSGGFVNVTDTEYDTLPKTFDAILPNLAAPTNDNYIVNLYAIWLDCQNNANVQEWVAGTCEIKSCNPGYRIVGTGASATCSQCNVAGYYCPGGDPTSSTYCKDGTPALTDADAGYCTCAAGYYCPGTGSCAVGDAITNAPGFCKCSHMGTTSATNSTGPNACIFATPNAFRIPENSTKFCDTQGCFYAPNDAAMKI